MAQECKRCDYECFCNTGRKFIGVGELERSGYIPEGSAAEREAKNNGQPDYGEEQESWYLS